MSKHNSLFSGRHPSHFHASQARLTANLLIYASVVLGVALLAQLHSVVPSWLFYSVFIGWIAYLIVAIAATLQVSMAYPVSIVLAILTLVISLPQPEHYSFGVSLASLTFIVGSILQIGVILTVGRYLVLIRRESQQG